MEDVDAFQSPLLLSQEGESQEKLQIVIRVPELTTIHNVNQLIKSMGNLPLEFRSDICLCSYNDFKHAATIEANAHTFDSINAVFTDATIIGNEFVHNIIESHDDLDHIVPTEFNKTSEHWAKNSTVRTLKESCLDKRAIVTCLAHVINCGKAPLQIAATFILTLQECNDTKELA